MRHKRRNGDEDVREAERAFLADLEDEATRDRYLRELKRRGVLLDAVVAEAAKAYFAMVHSVGPHGIDSPVVDALCEPYEQDLIDKFEALEPIESIEDQSPVMRLIDEEGFAASALTSVVEDGGNAIWTLSRIGRRWEADQHTALNDHLNRTETNWLRLAKFDGDVPEQLGIEDDYATQTYHFEVVLFRTMTGNALRVSERRVRSLGHWPSSDFWWTIRYYMREGHS